MENKEQYACPNCGAVRVNRGPVSKKDEYIEHPGFCRQCETEFVVKEVKEEKKLLSVCISYEEIE